jgi:hypothetical protein
MIRFYHANLDHLSESYLRERELIAETISAGAKPRTPMRCRFVSALIAGPPRSLVKTSLGLHGGAVAL